MSADDSGGDLHDQAAPALGRGLHPYPRAARRDGKHYASDFNINQKIAPDRSIVGMPLTTHKLRMSYVYSVLSNSKLTEADYIEKLHLSMKTLNYYRKNMTLYVETSKFELKK